jgi:hypothetical protein
MATLRLTQRDATLAGAAPLAFEGAVFLWGLLLSWPGARTPVLRVDFLAFL